jgi:hypothetical protein
VEEICSEVGDIFQSNPNAMILTLGKIYWAKIYCNIIGQYRIAMYCKVSINIAATLDISISIAIFSLKSVNNLRYLSAANTAESQ